MSNGDHWMPLYIGDYLADTMELNGPEHGAYLLLLMHYWRNGPLVDDDAKLASIAKTDLRLWRKSIGPTVRAFFALNGDGRLHQKRADIERSHVSDVSAKRSEAGRAGGIAKHHPPNGGDDGGGNCQANASHLPEQNPKQNSSKQLANGQQKPEFCQDFATPQSPPDLEAEGTKEESLKTLPLGVVPAGARESAPSAVDIWAGSEADDDTPTHAEIERRRERFLREMEGAERTPAMIERIARSVRSTAVRPAGIATFRSRQDQINAICPQPKPTPHHLTPEQLAHARQLTRRLVPA
jgi:uncharacterized protein YdaU (DUF1376 family)